MPDYSSLSTQITAVKEEITASLAAATYTAQDLIYVTKSLETLGTLLGVNDIVAATADRVTAITTAGTTQLTAVNSAGTTQVSAVNTAGNNKVAAIQAESANLTTLAYIGVLA
jgi:hypothetical protein